MQGDLKCLVNHQMCHVVGCLGQPCKIDICQEVQRGRNIRMVLWNMAALYAPVYRRSRSRSLSFGLPLTLMG
jgi:hypothetical protein